MNNKIILVYPDYRDAYFSPSLPVGLGYIAESLKSAGIEYEIVDLNIDSENELVIKINRISPEFLGISMMSYRCESVYRLLHHLKRSFPGLTIIAGGPHITTNREDVLKECMDIDIGVVGEGEFTIIDIIIGKPIQTIRGILYRMDNNSINFTGEKEFIWNLDEVPFPTYERFNIVRYGKTIPIASSRGCPYKCIFCAAPRILGGKWRFRSPQSMANEVEYWYKRGYTHFTINDSNFALKKKRVEKFCEEIIDRDISAKFIGEGVRCDHLDYKLLKKMQEAGFSSLCFGVESGSDKVLLNLKKGETRDNIEKAIKAATDLGFAVNLFFVIGSPGEGIEDIRASFDLAKKYDVAKVWFFNLTPIPGTEFYNYAIEQGFIDPLQGKYPTGNFGLGKEALFSTDTIRKEELTYYIKKARRLEKQLHWRWILKKITEKIRGKRIYTNNVLFNTLSWLCVSSLIIEFSLNVLLNITKRVYSLFSFRKV